MAKVESEELKNWRFGPIPHFILVCEEGGPMFFTQLEAEAKVGKRVRVRNDESFLIVEVPQGTIGKVIEARRAPILVGVGPGQAMNPLREQWVVEVQFDNPTCFVPEVDKESYENDLEEI
jgi:hypothetical protein